MYELDALSRGYFGETVSGFDVARRNAGGLSRMNAQLMPVSEERQSPRERRLPRHIGFIPDGNRRWAVRNGLAKERGYENGIAPGVALFEACKALGIEEVSVFGFTQDNTRRAAAQADHFRAACVVFAREISRRGAALLVLGDEQSPAFLTASRKEACDRPMSRGSISSCAGAVEGD